MRLRRRAFLRALLVLVVVAAGAGRAEVARANHTAEHARTATLRGIVQTDTVTPGVSVAFDGKYLYWTNQGETSLNRIQPVPAETLDPSDTSGLLVGAPATYKKVPMPPLVDIDAIAFSTFDTLEANARRGADDPLYEKVFWGADKLGNIVRISLLESKDTGMPVSAVAIPVDNVLPDLAIFGDCDRGIGDDRPGCSTLVLNGLAVDSKGDLWYSPDQSPRIYRFRPTYFEGVSTGVDVAGFFDTNDLVPRDSTMSPECETNGNSGIAVGSPGTLFLTNAQCPDAFFAYGTTDFLPCPLPDLTGEPGGAACPEPLPEDGRPCYDEVNGQPALTFFICPGVKKAAYLMAPTESPESPQDVECDNRTSRGEALIWMRDFIGSEIRAYAVPQSQPCVFGGGVEEQLPPDERRFTGGGWAFATGSLTAKVHFGMTLHCNAALHPNRLQVMWDNGRTFHLEKLTSSRCEPPPTTTLALGGEGSVVGSGEGRCDGQKQRGRAEWRFSDNGEPGVNDQVELYVYCGTSTTPAVSTLALIGGGNVQVHKGSRPNG